MGEPVTGTASASRLDLLSRPRRGGTPVAGLAPPLPQDMSRAGLLGFCVAQGETWPAVTVTLCDSCHNASWVIAL